MRRKSKIFRSLLLVLTLALCLTACGTAPSVPSVPAVPTRVFTDSLGREVEVPAEPERIAVTGTMAQKVVFALCPDKLVGLADNWGASAEEYIEKKYLDLPVLGQLFGGKGELNLETLLASGAQLVIDIGQAGKGTADELDALQAQTQIPFVHISMRTETMGETFRLLGDLLGLPEAAQRLASYCETTYARIAELAQSAEKVRLLYLTGTEGLNVIAAGSYHAEVIDLLADNLAVVNEPSSKGTGNEVDAEQLLAWDPEVLLLAPDGIYDRLAEDPVLQNLTAVRNGNYFEVPQGPDNWMGFPPSVQRLLGMLWMGRLLYPEAAEYDLYEEVSTFYDLFYHCALTQKQYNVLVENSVGKTADTEK